MRQMNIRVSLICALLMAGFRAQAQTLEVIPLSQAWNYNASSNDLGQAWHATDYDDSTWDSGPAPLGREPDPIPVPIVTPLPYGPITHYFRTTFVFPTNAVGWKYNQIGIAHVSSSATAPVRV